MSYDYVDFDSCKIWLSKPPLFSKIAATNQIRSNRS